MTVFLLPFGETTMRRFEFSDSTSNKFWEVDVKGKTLNVIFGKIGTKGQSKPKDFATPEKAKAEMEKLIKEKTGKGYVEVGGKAVKAIKPVAKSAAEKKTSAGGMGEELSKAEKKAKAEKVLAMFAGGQWELARGILEAAQEEHWLFKELLEGCKIKANIPIPSKKIMDAFGEEKAHKEYDEDGELCYDAGPIKSELVALEVLLHLPKELEELEKLRDELGIKLRANILSKYWNEVAEGEFKGVDLNGGYPGFFADQWYEERESEIAKVEKECEVRSKALKKAWREEEDLGNGVSLEMILIPAGNFKMGSPASEKGRYDNETQHEVTLTKPFYMGKYEVTQEQWEAVMGKNPSYSKNVKNPVTGVSWDDCQEFLKKLNGITKSKYRLPTEAEWEYACRAGTRTAYSFGVKITPKDANYNGSMIWKPLPVGSYKPNAFGLYDMHGNIFEWCEDRFAKYRAGAVTDPKGPTNGKDRVFRGGSFYSYVSDARSSNRSSSAPAYRGKVAGFRLARTAL